MSRRTEHLRGSTFHGRRGGVANSFRYGIDYVLSDLVDGPTPLLFSRNRFNLAALHDADHGGTPGKGRGRDWVIETLAAHGLEALMGCEILLLAQPRVLGHGFNPVSFWLVMDGATLRLVIAEVTNTYGDRHSYLCHHDDLRPIQPTDRLAARKTLHVSPFQPVAGTYSFRFDVSDRHIGVVIDYKAGDDGVFATFHGKREPLTNRSILGAALARPFGSRRVLGLIHWQALKLWWKGAGFRARPEAPEREVS